MVTAAMAVSSPLHRLPESQAIALAEPRQSVILSQKGDHRTAVRAIGIRSHKRRRQSADAPLYCEALLLQPVSQQLRGSEFLEFGFRQLPDPVAQSGHGWPHPVRHSADFPP
ncbi:hypothetical protein D3C75_707150 [compost metagenome]